MPFFSSRRDASPEDHPSSSPEPTAREPSNEFNDTNVNTAAPAPGPSAVNNGTPKKRGLFSRRRNSSGGASMSNSSMHSAEGPSHNTLPPTQNPETATVSTADYTDNGSLSRSGTERNKNILQRSFGNGTRINEEMDPAIVEARERVMGAEAAEREADRAMNEARLRVREAREHVRRLEEEAKEEARRANIKHQQAREVSKRGRNLGRFGA